MARPTRRRRTANSSRRTAPASWTSVASPPGPGGGAGRPPQSRAGRGGRTGRGGGRGAGADRAGPRLRFRQDPRAQLPAARRTGHDRRAGLSCSRGAVAQAVPRRRHGAARGGPRPRDGDGLRAGLGAWRAAVSGSRRRPCPGGLERGARHAARDMNFDAFRFLAPKLWPGAVEIAIVAWVIYRFLLFLVGTRAIQIVVGLVILSITYFVAVFAKFTMISTLLGVVFTYGTFAAIVVFQPELRNALARLGQSRLMRAFSRGDRQSVAEEIAEALDRLSRAGTGAIVAVEGDIGLEEFITTGVPMEAKVSADLLTTIFTRTPRSTTAPC